MKFKETGGLWGAIIGFSAPIIALFVRSILPQEVGFVMEQVKQEIFRSPFFYSYMFLTVPVAFGLFGFFLGNSRDKVLEQNAQLERLNTILRNQSRTDDLTGQYNHRHILVETEKEIERAKRYGHRLSAMMLDIDQFKAINDRFGHLAGDEILRETASVLDASLRKIDILGRYGGDEFFVLLPESDRQAAQVVAERLLRNIRGHRFAIEGRPVPLTVSVGLHSIETVGEIDVNMLIDQADQALLEAKRAGKDRVSAV